VSFAKSLVIASPHSGSGKTTVSIGIMSALKKRGLKIQPFKVGPDFIDPGYHAAVCGVPSINLDGWMLDKSYNIKTFLHHSKGKDVSIIEGVMGLYDGCDGKSEDGSTAQIAKWLNSPVILVIDARSMARSAGALVYGFEGFDEKVTIAGVILNRVGSSKHYSYLKDAIEEKCRAKVVGYLPKDASIEIPERHLGLITAKENVLEKEFIEKIADLMENYIDLDEIMKIALPIDSKDFSIAQDKNSSAISVRVGVAYDEAFCFYYQDNFDILRQMGAEIVYFSPLRDSSLPEELDAIYLGGGYPELFARELESNQLLRKEIKSFAENGGIIYAECGGLMYLGKAVKDFDNNYIEMVEVFPFTTKMERRLNALGYYTVETTKDTILSKKGEVMRGHQFRYSSMDEIPSSLGKVYKIRKGTSDEVSKEGFAFKNVLASYVHLHFGSNENSASHFIESCRIRKKQN
jgi:cobyrinic acid a,c-diamide synthase